MSGARVVVTGVGLLTSLGGSARETMARLLAGERGFAVPETFSTEGYPVRLAAEVRGLDALARGLRPAGGRAWSRSDALAVLAAREALAQARLDPGAVPVELWLAASTGGMLETEQILTALFDHAIAAPEPGALDCHPISAPADAVSEVLGPFVMTRTLCSACSSGAVALGLGVGRLRAGAARAVLAGGVDAMSRLTYSGFLALASLDPAPCRPFDRGRRGLTLGEGAAFLVLEREDDARARGAEVLGEIAGFASLAEAHHITQPETSGETAEQVMRAALADAGLDPSRVEYVSAHGTGTPLNDPMEASAIGRLLGARAPEVPVSSQKGQIGHTLSAGGAVEAAITLLSMRAGVLPPSGGLVERDPAIALRLVDRPGVRAQVSVSLSNSFGFGGTDACLVLTGPGVSSPRDPPPAEDLLVTAVASLGSLGALRRGDSAAYLSGELDPRGARGAADPRARLDPASSRRLDLAARYAVLLALEALADAGEGLDRGQIGVVAGSAFGNADAAAAFCSRVAARGVRFASPLDFPNIVPSSPGAHASIVARLRGPSLTVADLATTPFAAVATAMDLVRDGRAGAMLAVVAEAPSRMAELHVAPACGDPGPGLRGDGGAAFLLEPRSVAERRGARPLCRLEWARTVRTPADPGRLRPPGARAEVLAVRDSPALRSLARALGWEAPPIRFVHERTGWHEAAGAIALAAGAARVSLGLVDEVLVLGVARGREGFALLTRP